MQKVNWNQEFPEVPNKVHSSVLDALSKLDGLEEPNMKKRTPKKRILLLAAAMVALVGTTAAAAGLFQWNERAEKVFEADEETQNKLVVEQIAEDVSASVTDGGLTIEAIQTIQDKNRFYALFEVTAEDANMQILPDYSMDYTIDYNGGEEPFVALTWGFLADYDQEISNKRYFEIHGTKMKDAPSDLDMNIHFTTLRGEPTQKAGDDGEVLATGNWDFALSIHESESIRHELQKEYEIDGYSMKVEAVELSPISFTIIYDGASVEAMEKGEQVNLDQLDDLPALYPTGVAYEDGTELEEYCHPLTEGFTNENHDMYSITMRFTKVVDPEKVIAFLMGEDKITF